MLSKNSFITGILAALIFPAIASGVAYLLRTDIDIINRPALPYFMAIFLNLVMLRFMLKKDLDKTGRGVMLGTFIIMLLVFIFKTHMR